jgi:hypothetical protein
VLSWGKELVLKNMHVCNVVGLTMINVERQVQELSGHRGRIGVLSWGKELASGGKDRKILLHDIRAGSQPVSTLIGHRSEVCGLRVCRHTKPSLVMPVFLVICLSEE